MGVPTKLVPTMASSAVLSSLAQGAVCTLQSLGRAAGMLSDTETPRVGAVCEATKDMLLSRAKKLVASSHGLPLLSSKSCDGTPIRCEHYSTWKLPGQKSQRGRAKRGVEVLVSNQFVRYQDPGHGWQTCCILSEPVPLTLGKEVPMVLAAARKTWHSLRALGACGCIVEHYCWDRAGLSALERSCREWHMSQPIPDAVHIWPEAVRQYLEFVVVTPCALHDSQNAFRWAFGEECKDRALMRDLYISVESLRNSADLLSSRLASWVGSCIRFVGEQGPLWRKHRRELWSGLDVSPEVVELLVEMELRWDGDQLLVMQGAQVFVFRFKPSKQQKVFTIVQSPSWVLCGLEGVCQCDVVLRGWRSGCGAGSVLCADGLLPFSEVHREPVAHDRC